MLHSVKRFTLQIRTVKTMSATPETRVEISMLLDFYSALLTPRQRQITELYYAEDMSLSEIAEETGITRQGVRDALKKAETQLFDTEEKLGLVKRFQLSQERFEFIINRLEKIGAETGIDFSDIVKAAKDITE